MDLEWEWIPDLADIGGQVIHNRGCLGRDLGQGFKVRVNPCPGGEGGDFSIQAFSIALPFLVEILFIFPPRTKIKLKYPCPERRVVLQ